MDLKAATKAMVGLKYNDITLIYGGERLKNGMLGRTHYAVDFADQEFQKNAV